jgi:hypothetical protein
MQSSPVCCHFFHLRYKYSPQHPVLRHNLCSSLSVRDEVLPTYVTLLSVQYKNNCNTATCYLFLSLLFDIDNQWTVGDKHVEFWTQIIKTLINFVSTVRNLVSHFEWGTQTEGFWEQRVEEDIWT